MWPFEIIPCVTLTLEVQIAVVAVAVVKVIVEEVVVVSAL
jgi:hypothetical protein